MNYTETEAKVREATNNEPWSGNVLDLNILYLADPVTGVPRLH